MSQPFVTPRGITIATEIAPTPSPPVPQVVVDAIDAHEAIFKNLGSKVRRAAAGNRQEFYIPLGNFPQEDRKEVLRSLRPMIEQLGATGTEGYSLGRRSYVGFKILTAG